MKRIDLNRMGWEQQIAVVMTAYKNGPARSIVGLKKYFRGNVELVFSFLFG